MRIIKREVPPSVAESLREWLKTRPPVVQKLAEEFPPGCIIEAELHGEPVVFYLLGWTEDDSLIVSGLDPADGYDLSMLMKRFVCAGHFRKPH